jgi:amidase
MGEIWQCGAVALSRMIRQRELSSVEVVEGFLERIQAVNRSINAVVVLAQERAMTEARAADASLTAGRFLGPLHGVPFTVKDVFDTAGLETSVGIPERVGLVPTHDAAVVARMRGAGGILLGKTNAPPGGAGGVTDNSVYGRTNNPYARERSPGGSSGGEAALQGAGGSPVGLGSDSGGSLRVPAHLCGVATLKPTSGRVPNTGAFDHPGGMSDTRTQIGPLSRYVEDLTPILKIVAGPDGRDSGVVPMPVDDPDAVELRGLRVAFYTDDGATPTTTETAASVAEAADALAQAGASVTEACPQRIGQDALDITHRYWAWEELPGGETVRLLADWDSYRSRLLTFMQSFDVIVCPASPAPAGLHGEGLESMFNYTLPYSLSGQPCVVVPVGTSPEGLPIGVQVVARVWKDEVAVAVAQHLEVTVGGWWEPTRM